MAVKDGVKRRRRAFTPLTESILSTYRRTTALVAAIVAAVAITQISAGAYGNDLASYPDEAAHFVSAVCLLDYIALAPGSDPVAFAQAYYAHFPRVAFGHWPPGFFIEQAAWYAVFGASAPAGMLLVGITALAAAFVVFRTIRRFFGSWTAMATVAVYLALPTVRSATTTLMPDLAVSLFAFMAVRALAEGCVQNRWRPWLASAGWSTALVLTKESGLLVLVFAPLAFVLFAGEQRSSKRAACFWGSLAILCVGTLAVYKGTGVLQMRGLPSTAGLPPFRTRVGFLYAFARSTPWVVLLMGGFGAAAAVAMRTSPVDRRVHTRCHALWVASWLLGQVMFRDIIEPRYFLPAVPSLMVLFAAGVDRLDAAVQRAMRSSMARMPGRRPVVSIAVGLCCLALMPPMGEVRRRGYAAAVDSLRESASPQAVLISSDASGAGALIADIVARRRDENIVAVRSDKVLASSDWMGSHARLLTSTTEETLRVLDSIPVRYIVLDVHASIHDFDRRPHRLLRETLLSRPDRFRLVASLPLLIDDRRYDDALQVFENAGMPDGSDGAVHVPSAALPLGRRGPHPGEWVPRSSSAIDRDLAVARIIQAGVDRLRTILPSIPSDTGLPPIRPVSDRIGAAGGLGELLVAPDFSDLPVESSDPWITVSSGPGKVEGRLVRYRVAANDSPRERSGFISVGGVHYSVSQEPRW
jgi:hypothetical protein